MNRVIFRKRKKNTHIDLRAIKQYLEQGSYPVGYSKFLKRTIRKRSERFVIDKNELFYLVHSRNLDDETIDTEPETNRESFRKAIIDVRDQLSLTTRIHISETGVHMGMDRTLNALTSKYYWVGMTSTVNKIIKSCPVCMSRPVRIPFQPGMSYVLPKDEIKSDVQETDAGDATEQKETVQLMSSEPQTAAEDNEVGFDINTTITFQSNMMASSEIPKAQHFWERVEIQILYADENQKKKNEDKRRKRKNFVILAMDSFSKWPEVMKMEKVNEQTVSEFIIKLISRFGVMNQIVILENDVISEQPVVVSGIIENLNAFPTMVTCETVNPFDEHWVRICKVIWSFVKRYQESWSSCLDLCLMALRNSVSPKTDYSPAFVALRREPVLPNFLFPQYSGNSEIMLNQDQLEAATDNIMRKYQECCEADVKAVIAPVNSIPLYLNTRVNSESLPGVRRSNRKVMLSHRLAGFDITSPALEKERHNSAGNEGSNTHSFDIDQEAASLRNGLKGLQNADNVTKGLSSSDINRNRKKNEEFSSKMDVDVYYKIIKDNIEKGTYPPNSPENFKRGLRITRKGYSLENKKLIYHLRGKKRTVMTTLRERLQKLNEIHTSTEDHLPRIRVVEEFEKQKLFWKNMAVDIGAYIKACPHCKHGQTKPRVKKTYKAWQKGDDDDENEDENYPDNSSLQKIIQFLKTGLEPDQLSRSELVLFKKKAKNFKLLKGVLHYCLPNSESKPRKVLLTHEERHEAIHKAHGDSHLSLGHMMVELQRLYFWRPMTTDVENYLNSCCQKEIEVSDKKEGEFKERYEMFKRHFEGEDICGGEVSLDFIFKQPVDERLGSYDDLVPPSTLIQGTEKLYTPSGERETDAAGAETDVGKSKTGAAVLNGLLQTAEKPLMKEDKSVDSKENLGMELNESTGVQQEKAVQNMIMKREIPRGLVVRKKGVRFRCEVCKAIVVGENNYKEHMYKHTGIKPFTCQVCSKKYTSVKGMRLHMRKHTGHRPYLCNICGRGFPRCASLRYHMKTHERGNTAPAACDVCKRVFTTEHRLMKHKRFKHPAVKPVYKCDACGKHFTAKRSLKRHQEAHQGIRRYECEVCKRSFFRKEYLTYHLNSHYKDDPSMAHLAPKRKFRRRGNANQLLEKESSNILSLLTVEPGIDQEEVYTQLVEVSNTQPWTQESDQEHSSHTIPAVFGLDGAVQTTEVVSQGEAGTPIVMIEGDSTSTAEAGMDIHQIIMQDPQVDPGIHAAPQAHHLQVEESQHLQQAHIPQVVIANEDNGRIEVQLANGQRLTLARTEGVSVGGEGQETVQYHVQCLSGEAVTEADLNTLRMLAGSSVLPQ